MGPWRRREAPTDPYSYFDAFEGPSSCKKTLGLCELSIAHRRKKENGELQSSDRLCKNQTKYSSPGIEASSAARSSANSGTKDLPTWLTATAPSSI